MSSEPCASWFSGEIRAPVLMAATLLSSLACRPWRAFQEPEVLTKGFLGASSQCMCLEDTRSSVSELHLDEFTSSPYLSQPLKSFLCIMPRDSWYLSWAILSPSTDERKQWGPESQALIPCPVRPVLAAMRICEVSPRLSSVSQQFLGILGVCPLSLESAGLSLQLWI